MMPIANSRVTLERQIEFGNHSLVFIATGQLA